MNPITPRNRSRSAEADAYWRRRLFALAAGLAVFGLLAWAVGGAAGTRQTAATTSLNSHSPQPSVTPVSASPAPSPSPSVSPSPAGTSGSHQKHGKKPAGKAVKSTGAHAGHAAAAAKSRPRGNGCPAADVVISLTSSSNSYGPGTLPGFGVSVVSTDSQTCTLDTGSRHLALVIASGGVRVWGSADCAGKSGASVIKKLARGVPLQLRLSWDRLLSAPGCRLPRTPARPGTYTVTASDGQSHSRTLVFVLR